MNLRGVKPEDLVCTDEEVFNSATAAVTDHILAIQGSNAEQNRVLLENAERVHRKTADVIKGILEQNKPELVTVH